MHDDSDDDLILLSESQGFDSTILLRGRSNLDWCRLYLYLYGVCRACLCIQMCFPCSSWGWSYLWPACPPHFDLSTGLSLTIDQCSMYLITLLIFCNFCLQIGKVLAFMAMVIKPSMLTRLSFQTDLIKVFVALCLQEVHCWRDLGEYLPLCISELNLLKLYLAPKNSVTLRSPTKMVTLNWEMLCQKATLSQVKFLSIP